jgi:hypothetical protein
VTGEHHECERVLIAATGAGLTYTALQVFTVVGITRLIAPPVVLVLLIMVLVSTAVAAVVGGLMWLVRASRASIYIGVSLAIPLLLKSQSAWVLLREVFSSEKVAQWTLPLQLCEAYGPEAKLSRNPRSSLQSLYSGSVFWACSCTMVLR